MNVTTISIIGGIVVVVVVFFAFKNRRAADTILQNNNNVVPLLLQKSTQVKVARLQQVTEHDTVANGQLQKLASAYKANQINIQQYNEKLDSMIARLEIEL